MQHLCLLKDPQKQEQFHTSLKSFGKEIIQLLKPNLLRMAGMIATSFLLSFLPVSLFSQAWNWLNPRPQGNALNYIFFADANTGYSVGDLGTIMKTSNAGSDWEQLNSGTAYNLKCAYFTDVSIQS